MHDMHPELQKRSRVLGERMKQDAADQGLALGYHIGSDGNLNLVSKAFDKLDTDDESGDIDVGSTTRDIISKFVSSDMVKSSVDRGSHWEFTIKPLQKMDDSA